MYPITIFYSTTHFNFLYQIMWIVVVLLITQTEEAMREGGRPSKLKKCDNYPSVASQKKLPISSRPYQAGRETPPSSIISLQSAT